MIRVLLLTCSLLFSTMGGLLAHPVPESSEMQYSEPGRGEGGAAFSPGELSLWDQTSASGTGRGRDGLRSAAFIPVGSVKEELLGKPAQLHPFLRFLGPRKPYEKRGNPTECFWKYCV